MMMVERECECGCGQVFKVLESSTQVHASRVCVLMAMKRNGESTKSSSPFYFMTKKEAVIDYNFKRRKWKKNAVAD